MKLFKKENIAIFVLAVLYILANAKLYLLGFEWLWLMPIALWVVLLAIFAMDSLLFLLLFLVPLSIPLSHLVPGLPFNVMLPTEPIILGLTFLFLIKVIREEYFDKDIIFHPVTLAIFFNLFWILVTSFTSEMPGVSFKFLASRFWFIVVFYLIASQLFTKFSNIVRYFWYYAAGLGIVVMLAVGRLAVVGLTKHQEANKVVRPFFNDHTDYAAAVTMILVFMVGLLILKRKAKGFEKLFYIGSSVFFIIALILSYTRASWLSLVVALGFFAAMFLRFRLKIIFLIAGILLSLFLVFQNDIIMALERNKQDSDKDLSKHITSAANISTDASNMERLNRWHCAIKMFNERPVFGFGPGTYQFQYAPFQVKGEMTIISTNRGDVGNSHSEYLGPLAESGVLGTVSFVLIIITTMATASKLYFRSNRRKVRILAITLLVAMITYYSHGFLNNFLDTDKLSALFWGFTAMIVSLDVYHSKNLKKA